MPTSLLDELIGDLIRADELLSRDQVQEALRTRSAGNATPLLLLLVEQGVLTVAQVGGFLSRHEARLHGIDPQAPQRAEMWRFAALAAERGWCTDRALQAGLCEHARREPGAPWPSLEAILTEHGSMRRPGSGPAAGSEDATVAAASAAEGRPAKLPDLQRIGKYELIRVLGRGGAGMVYLAHHPGLKSQVAVKILLPGGDASEAALRRFHLEAEAAAKLRHPGIVAVHDIGVEDGRTYIAMEYVDGGNLQHLVGRPEAFGVRSSGNGGIEEREALRIVAAIADAMQAAHEAGVIHRDLKPANVLRDHAGNVKIMDFGLAKLVDAAGTQLTRTGAVMGTPAYMSPEQARGENDQVDERSDVYQMGAILYHLVTGVPPFEGAITAELVLRLAMGEAPPAPRWRNPALGRDVETICLKAMGREWRDRYATARELAEDCRRCLTGETIRARRTTWFSRAAAWTRRRKTLSTLLGTVTILGVLIVLFIQYSTSLESAVLRDMRAISRSHVELVLQRRRAGEDLEEVGKRFQPPVETVVEAAIDTWRAGAEPYYHRGRLLRALLRFEEALAAHDEALRSDPEFGPSLYQRAMIRFRLYLDHLRGSQDAGAKDPRADELRAAVLVDLGKLAGLPDESGLGAGEAMNAPPILEAGMREVAGALARMLAAEPQASPEGVETALSQCAKDASVREEAVEGLAHLRVRRGEVGRAVELLSEAIGLDAGYVPFLLDRGRLRMVQGNWVEAVGDFERALALRPAVAPAVEPLLAEARGQR